MTRRRNALCIRLCGTLQIKRRKKRSALTKLNFMSNESLEKSIACLFLHCSTRGPRNRFVQDVWLSRYGTFLSTGILSIFKNLILCNQTSSCSCSHARTREYDLQGVQEYKLYLMKCIKHFFFYLAYSEINFFCFYKMILKKIKQKKCKLIFLMLQRFILLSDNLRTKIYHKLVLFLKVKYLLFSTFFLFFYIFILFVHAQN
ncbi:hypothetical protein PUN28_013486 [Cardiocondyla obscurior]|uniref:Transmembrane protein n=1 Tax=Cardiocondyla obscurior TaxID=286306 RepID=A0AAW2F586_9HYME